MTTKIPTYQQTCHYSCRGIQYEWTRHCEILCQQKEYPCNWFYKEGSSKIVGNWGKRVKDRTKIFFTKNFPPLSTSKHKGHQKNIININKARLDMTNAVWSKTPSQLVGFDVEAHHILSSSVVTSKEFIELAEAAAYDVNNGWNCILLPMDFGFQKWDNLQRHRGKHKDKMYFKKVQKELEIATDNYKKTDFCNYEKMKNLHKKFHNAEERMFKQLQKNAVWLYQYSKTALGNDYRSEMGPDKDDYLKWEKQKKSVGSYYRIKKGGAIDKDAYSNDGYPIF